MPSLEPIADPGVQDGERGPGASPAARLPDEVRRWVEQVAGEISMLARHPARREAWLIDTQLRGGPTRHGFLRLDRPGVTPSVNVEAEVVEVLAGRGIPVPALYEANPALSVALYERVEGDDSVATLPAGEAQAIMEHFRRRRRCLAPPGCPIPRPQPAVAGDGG
jgi:hypothetical protein